MEPVLDSSLKIHSKKSQISKRPLYHYDTETRNPTLKDLLKFYITKLLLTTAQNKITIAISDQLSDCPLNIWMLREREDFALAWKVCTE